MQAKPSGILQWPFNFLIKPKVSQSFRLAIRGQLAFAVTVYNFYRVL